MSFADRLRQELAEMTLKHNCCKRALADGLLIGAVVSEMKSISIRYTNQATADLAMEELSARYGKVPDLKKSGKCGHSYWDLTLSSPACLRTVRAMDAEAIDIDTLYRFDCDACRGNFLRGMFLACGTVSDPHKSFHLEFKLPTHRARIPMMLFESLGYAPRTVTRAGQTGVYFKDGSAIEELVTLMGAGHMLFEIINSRIEREIRNNENRATNCVARNIEKTIAAATKQIEAINRLMETGKLQSLPESLRITAEQRYANPDASLDELVALHVPSISRSGLNHRLQKLVDAADELST